MITRRADRRRAAAGAAGLVALTGLTVVAAVVGTAQVRPGPLAAGWALAALGVMTTAFWWRSQPVARRTPLVFGLPRARDRRAVRFAVARRQVPADAIDRLAAWDLARHRVVAGTAWPGVALTGLGTVVVGTGWGGALTPVALLAGTAVVLVGLLAAVRGPDAMAYLALAEPAHDAETVLDASAVVDADAILGGPAVVAAPAPPTGRASPAGATLTDTPPAVRPAGARGVATAHSTAA